MSAIKSEGYLLKFGVPDMDGDIMLKSAINPDSFKNLKTSVEILDHYIDDNGIKVVTDIKLKSVSINNE